MRRIAFLLFAAQLVDGSARACGCFAPPGPSQPVVQAGERILFVPRDGIIEAHIQIQFAGQADDFGWLLPLPSVPKLELGTDELFARLGDRTGPRFDVKRVFPTNCGPQGGAGGGFGADLAAAPSRDGGAPPSPVVIQDSIGPYDFAVLRADDKKEMLDWLAKNRYFVPVGTDDVVGPYIRPGAYFLALKLRAGRSAGDLQPVIVRYASDLAMIPIVLTSVTATPNMGIQVWLLGPGRAIPRNYHHVVLNQAEVFAPGANYGQVVTRAASEAPGRHAFVTEFAGPSSIMDGALDWPWRFGSVAKLRTLSLAVDYLEYLRANGYLPSGNLIAILSRHIPIPDQWKGIPAAQFYWNYRFYGDPGATIAKPAALTDEIEKQVIEPTRAAAKLFKDHPYLTQLYTTLSPEDMNADPVFSFNPSLPDVSNVHRATLTYLCGQGQGFPTFVPGRLTTDDGLTVDWSPNAKQPRMPAAMRIEILREEGAPEVVRDNRTAIEDALGLRRLATGCAVVAPVAGAGPAPLLAGLALLLGLALLIGSRRAT